MADIARLTQMIEPEATALGFDLVRVAMFGGGDDLTLQVMAERPDTRQLTIDDCADLSRRISDVLDAAEAAGNDPIDGAYQLEVSSPGIDRPLTRVRDFADWTGHEARITLAEKLDGQKQFRGELLGVDDKVGDTGAVVMIRTRDGGTATLPFAAIADAKLVMTDKLIAATRPLSAEGADEEELHTEDQD